MNLSGVIVRRGVVVLAVVWLMLALMLAARLDLFPQPLAAGLAGRYVQLLAVTDDGRVSVVHDLTAAECDQIITKLRELTVGWRELSCLPIDYNKENKKR